MLAFLSKGNPPKYPTPVIRTINKLPATRKELKVDLVSADMRGKLRLCGQPYDSPHGCRDGLIYKIQILYLVLCDPRSLVIFVQWHSLRQPANALRRLMK